MPKRRGRSAAGASRRSAVPSFGNIEELLRRMQDVQAASVPPLETPQRGGNEAISLGLETTLSPDARAPPPPPQVTSSPREEELPVEGRHLPSEARENSEGSVEMDSLSFQVSPKNIEELETSRTTSGQQKDYQEQLKTGETIQTFNSSYVIEKPREVTLDSIWDLVADLAKFVKSQLLQLENKITLQETEIKNIKVEIGESKNSIENIQQELKASKQLNEAIIKDNTNMRRKLETLENFSRNNNLRLIKFPKIPSVTPRDMLKRYMLEILGIPEDTLPPLTQVYYLPMKPIKSPSKQQENNQPINVSAILELSDRELASPATLLLTVALAPDKNWLLRLFFRNKMKEFLGQKILMFPDLARETQRRRREFLLLKPGVISLGGTFFLRHPYKCVIQYHMKKYVFFEPFQLTAFLVGTWLDEGKSK